MNLWTRFQGEDTLDNLDVELTQAEELDLGEYLITEETEELSLDDLEPKSENGNKRRRSKKRRNRARQG